MLYPKDFESKIGFAPLRQILGEKCETPMGRHLVDVMKFSSDRDDILYGLHCVNEMKAVLESNENLPHDSFYDILPYIKACQAPGSFMIAERLYQCAVTFVTMNSVREFFTQNEERQKKYPNLYNEFRLLPEYKTLTAEILRCIDKDGTVKDSASPGLYEVRRAIESVSKSMHKVMRKIIDNSIREGIVDKDVTPSVRDGHLVLPVSASNKKSIQGILHDASASGKTFFIEPAEVVEAGNRLRELSMQEEQEIIAVLINLTAMVYPEMESIAEGCRLLANYDFIRAKARFAKETGGEMPVIEKQPELDWYHAVHPGLLLMLRKQNREVVPLNIKLDKDTRILVISGPNAGGKSVTLKTVGTVQYMMQCGMLPTLYSNSHMGVFRNIFIDIGDEQSMENDLSTYSSHLSNMKYFLQNANQSTLILADEMGSGTEPQIGAALAQSVIIELGRSGCLGVITTHYQNLKILAENEDGFINGSMLYDRQHLRPTFQLLIGQPGSSFALEIARNIGLPQKVLDNAKEIVGSEYVDSEKFLMDIQRDRKYWKNKRLDIREKENRLNKLLEEYENKAGELKQQRSQILKTAREQAKEILSGANTQIERSIHEIRKTQADKEKAKQVRKELEEYKRSLETSQDKNDLPEALKPLKHKSRKKKNEPALLSAEIKTTEFKAGDYVKVDNGGVAGQIITISGRKAEVAFGSIRMNVEVEKLHPAKKPAAKSGDIVLSSSSVSDSGSRQRQLNFKQEIDVRGMRADEALQAVTYFIDDAVQFNASRVRILHGTGHGILRTLIREYLQSNPNVSFYQDEDVRFGGAGITVVSLI